MASPTSNDARKTTMVIIKSNAAALVDEAIFMPFFFILSVYCLEWALLIWEKGRWMSMEV
jgi:hypothetical protein